MASAQSVTRSTAHQEENITDVKPLADVELNINNQYQTELSVIGNMCYCDDDSLWISCPDQGLKRVKPEGTTLNILSSFNDKVYGMAVTQSNDLLITTGKSRIKQISGITGTLTDSNYNVSPLIPTVVHITSDNKVLVGCVNERCPEPGRRVVILMNQNGNHERVYENDQQKKPIFTRPGGITTTRNGNIHVLDTKNDDKIRSRVVVLTQGGEIIKIYTGDAETTTAMGNIFLLNDIVTTRGDKVIAASPSSGTLHILNNAGILLTMYKTRKVGIEQPWSLNFTPTGQLFIGCNNPKKMICSMTEDNETNEVCFTWQPQECKAELFYVTISEC